VWSGSRDGDRGSTAVGRRRPDDDDDSATPVDWTEHYTDIIGRPADHQRKLSTENSVSHTPPKTQKLAFTCSIAYLSTTLVVLVSYSNQSSESYV